MKETIIEYIAPTSKAIGRMTTILFRPFDMGKWFSLGFSAWLATLFSGNLPSFNFPGGWPTDVDTEETEEAPTSPDFKEWIEQARQYILDNLDWIVPVAGSLIILFIVLVLVVTWLSSRGKFMLLENLVYNRGLVVEPWKRFQHQGNSLFLWRIGFSIISGLLFLAVIGGSGYYIYQNLPENLQDFQFETPLVVAAVGGFAGMFLIALVATYINRMLLDFVVPISYKHSLSITEAWGRFLGLHRVKVGSFILYFLWSVALQFVAGIITFIVVIATCCLGGILLSLPYLGAVLMLPITLIFQALGPEFLRQFGDEFDLWEGSLDGGFSPPPALLPS